MAEDNGKPETADGAALADPGTVSRLRAEGVLDAGLFLTLLRILRPAAKWRSWARAHLLGIGWALVLAGVVCVFAHNYATMGRFVKLGVLFAGTTAAALGAWRLGRERASGQALLGVAMVLVGVLFAVFGQIYQTGADAWQLFALWAGMTALWAAAGRSPWLWVIWLAVATAAVAGFVDEVVCGGWYRVHSETAVYAALAGVYGVALGLCDFAWRREKRWGGLHSLLLLAVLFTADCAVARCYEQWCRGYHDDGWLFAVLAGLFMGELLLAGWFARARGVVCWLRWLLWAAVLAALTVAVIFVSNWYINGDRPLNLTFAQRVLYPLSWLAALLGGFGFYFRRRPDTVCLTEIYLAAAAEAVALALCWMREINVIFEMMLIIGAVLVLAAGGGAVLWAVRRTAAALRRHAGEAGNGK